MAQIFTPKQLIVCAENLNLRSAPNTNSAIVDQLNNEEVLETIEVVDKNLPYQQVMLNSWIKVRRTNTGQEGFVYGEYVKSLHGAYLPYQNCNRIQAGYWYGIYNIENDLFLEEASPKITIQEEIEYGYIESNKTTHKLIICSPTPLQTGKIKGRFFNNSNNQNGFMSIGVWKDLIRIDDQSFDLVCTGEVSLELPGLTRKNEKIHFVKTIIDGGQRNYESQDLTEYIIKYGENGYSIVFAGDLNGDGIPEILFGEGDTKQGTYYYFVSNAEGKMKLEAVMLTSSGC